MQAHASHLELNPENHGALIVGMDYLVNISYVEVSFQSQGHYVCSLFAVFRVEGFMPRRQVGTLWNEWPCSSGCVQHFCQGALILQL